MYSELPDASFHEATFKVRLKHFEHLLLSLLLTLSLPKIVYLSEPFNHAGPMKSRSGGGLVGAKRHK